MSFRQDSFFLATGGLAKSIKPPPMLCQHRRWDLLGLWSRDPVGRYGVCPVSSHRGVRIGDPDQRGGEGRRRHSAQWARGAFYGKICPDNQGPRSPRFGFPCDRYGNPGGRGIEGRDFVHLDLTHLGKERLAEKLSDISSFAKIYLGIDPAREPIPVQPTCHYMMGGIPPTWTGKCWITSSSLSADCTRRESGACFILAWRKPPWLQFSP